MKSFSSIDAYIAAYPEDVQKILQKVRQTIHAAAPQAKEAIKYGIPTFVLNGNLVHFGGFKKHIGFYPAPSGLTAFQKELAPYVAGKGSVQFPLDQPIPFALITKIVKYRITENVQKGKNKMTPSQLIDKQIATAPAWQGKIMTTLRAAVHKADPDMTEEWKWDTGVWTHNGMVCAISGFKDHVKINFFKGALLKDSAQIINGGLESKKHRSIDFFEGDEVSESAVVDLVKQAVALNS